MTPEQLHALRPEAETVAAIEIALDRIDAAKREAGDRREAAEAERERYLAEGASEKQRAAIDNAISAAMFDLDQLAGIERDLAGRLDAAARREAEATREAELAAIRAEAEGCTARWDAALPGLVEQIAALANERRGLAARAEAAGLPALAYELRAGAEWVPPSTAAMREREAERETAARAERVRAEAIARWSQRGEAAEAMTGEPVVVEVPKGRTIIRDGRNYGPGQHIEMPDYEAAELLAAGAAIRPGDPQPVPGAATIRPISRDELAALPPGPVPLGGNVALGARVYHGR